MAQTRDMQLRENEYLKSLKSEAKKQRNAAIEAMTQQLETDTQPDGIPYTVLADHLTDRTIFIQGLRNAGFEIHDENILVVPFRDPDAVIVTFASGAHAKRAMLALHLRDFRGMEGRKMSLTKASPQVVGPDYRDPYAPVPTFHAAMQAMAQVYYERSTGCSRTKLEVAARLAKEAKAARKAANVQVAQEVKLAKDVNKLKNKKKQEEASLAKQAKKAANIKTAQEAKLAADLRKAEKRKKAENVVRDVRKTEGPTQAKDAKNSAKTVEEMEETRRAKDDAKAANHLAKRMAEIEAWVAKRLRKEANIKLAQEEKSAADLRKEAKRVQHIKWVEEGKLRKNAKVMMAQQSGGFCDDCFFEGVEDIEAVAGEEPEIGAWFEAMRQQHRDMEELKTALLGCDALLADIEEVQWDAVTRVIGPGTGEDVECVVK